MSIEISHETEVRLADLARRQGVSIDALLERFISEAGVAHAAEPLPDLPALHLGAMGPLHRKEIYDDVR